jgi:hypothetical protein
MRLLNGSGWLLVGIFGALRSAGVASGSAKGANVGVLPSDGGF